MTTATCKWEGARGSVNTHQKFRLALTALTAKNPELGS